MKAGRGITVLCTLIVVFAWGCIGGAQTLTMVVHWSAGDPMFDTLRAKADLYQELHPGIEIQILGGHDPVDRQVVVMTAGGVPPDLFHTIDYEMASLVGSGLTAPVPREVSDRMRAFFYPSVLERLEGERGGFFGIPTENMVSAMAIDIPVFDAHGLAHEVPTWDDLTQVAMKLHAQDAGGNVTRWGAALPLRIDQLLAFLKSNNATFLDDENQLRISSVEAQETLEYLRNLATERRIVDAYGLGGSSIPSGTAALVMSLPWHRYLYLDLPDWLDRIVTAPLPRGPRGTLATGIYNYLWHVHAQSAHADAAWQFLVWLTMTPGSNGVTPMGEIMSIVASLPTNQNDLENNPVYRFEMPWYQGFITGLTEGQIAGIKMLPESRELYQRVLQSEARAFILGNQSLAQTLSNIETRAAALLK